MRIVAQRVVRASVTVENEVIGQIGKGLLVYCGIGPDDDEATVKRMAEKVVKMRLWDDETGRSWRLSVIEQSGILVISQFTLYAQFKKGNKPDFHGACEPNRAEKLYNTFFDYLCKLHHNVQQGKFGAYMLVDSVNDGPVTVTL